MDYKSLYKNILLKKSFLCIGLDSDIQKIPAFLQKEGDPLFTFNKMIIDATADLALCYKPNTAFYEALGTKGWIALEKTVEYLRLNHPDIFVIADAKRGDIGNTSNMYARAFFEAMDFDAITVSPYMGHDSVTPFMGYSNKWVVLLALTSNQGSADFQQLWSGEGPMYQSVLQKSLPWGSKENMMYVVGATKAEELKTIRQIVPDHFLLIPGVGTQGGDLRAVAKNGINKNCGLLVNASRSIIYAGQGKGFDASARKEAIKIQSEMKDILEENNLYL
jgi:orotidine-5'-phosphate decarboxylase